MPFGIDQRPVILLHQELEVSLGMKEVAVIMERDHIRKIADLFFNGIQPGFKIVPAFDLVIETPAVTGQRLGNIQFTQKLKEPPDKRETQHVLISLGIASLIPDIPDGDAGIVLITFCKCRYIRL